MDICCETCRFWTYYGEFGVCSILERKTEVTEYCDDWQDEDGNTILGEDW